MADCQEEFCYNLLTPHKGGNNHGNWKQPAWCKTEKWISQETLPDIRQAKRLAARYGLSLDVLTGFDGDAQEIQEVLDRTSEETSGKIDWTKMWSKKYPILAQYQQEVDTRPYTRKLQELLDSLKKEYRYGELDAFLVLKDILAGLWKQGGE